MRSLQSVAVSLIMTAIDYTLKTDIIENPEYLRAAQQLAFKTMMHEIPANWYVV